MRIHRFLSLTDLVVASLVLLAIVLPKRPFEAVDAYALDAEDRAALAALEARVHVHPDDGALAAELSRRLGDADMLDWSVEAAVEGAARAGDASRWRAMRAVSEAWADRSDVHQALAWAERAHAACRAAGAACPSWDELKLGLYVRYLDAGLRSGIDPRREPRRFRAAAGQALRSVEIRGVVPGVPRDPAPSPGPGPAPAPDEPAPP